MRKQILLISLLLLLSGCSKKAEAGISNDMPGNPDGYLY